MSAALASAAPAPVAPARAAAGVRRDAPSCQVLGGGLRLDTHGLDDSEGEEPEEYQHGGAARGGALDDEVKGEGGLKEADGARLLARLPRTEQGSGLVSRRHMGAQGW